MKVSAIVAYVALAATTASALPNAAPAADAVELERRATITGSLSDTLTTLQNSVNGLTGNTQTLVTGLIANIQGILGII